MSNQSTPVGYEPDPADGTSPVRYTDPAPMANVVHPQTTTFSPPAAPSTTVISAPTPRA